MSIVNTTFSSNPLPQVDFSRALSSPSDNVLSPSGVARTGSRDLPDDVTAQIKSENLAGLLQLDRSTWTNISLVMIACVGSLLCAFYIFDGLELPRAAAARSRKLLYRRPPASIAHIDNSRKQNGADRAVAGNAATPSSNPDRGTTSPFDRNFWPQTLSSPITFGPVGVTRDAPPNAPPSFASLSLSRLNTLPRGADAPFKSFYETTTKMIAFENLVGTTNKTLASTRKGISSSQQNASGRVNSAAPRANRTAKSTSRRRGPKLVHNQLHAKLCALAHLVHDRWSSLMGERSRLRQHRYRQRS